MSLGQLRIDYDLFPQEPDSAFHLSDTADYGPWTFSQEDFALGVKLIGDVVRAADNSLEGIDFSQYDIVVIFHSGADLQGDINGDSPWDLPSFSAELADPIPVNDGTAFVYGASVIPETSSQDGLIGAINGVVVHEFGHMIGLSDLYNTDEFMPAIGYWSLMDTGNYLGGVVEDPNTGELVFVFGLLPGGLDAWSRRELGRVLGVQTVQEVAVGSQWQDTLRAVEITSDMLNVPLSSTEYYMVENREGDLDGNDLVEVRADTTTGVILGPESNEYDALLPGSGVLVWHIDEAILARRSSMGLSPNGAYGDRGISLEEADGIVDLGNPTSSYWLGSMYDPYFVGNATQLNPATVPNSDDNSGAASQVFISVGSPWQVGMYVSAERKWAREGWPAVAGRLEDTYPGFGDFDTDGLKEIFLAAPDSTVRVWKADGSTYLPGEESGRFVRAPGRLLSTLCYSEEASAIAGTLMQGNVGLLYAWAVNDAHSPLSPGQVLAGWPPVTPSVTTSPCTVGQDFIVGCSDGKIYAIDAGGVVRWNSLSPIGAPVRGSIAAGDMNRDGNYEVGFSGGDFLAVVRSPGGEFLFSPVAVTGNASGDSPGPFLLMADVDSRPDSTLEIVAVTGNGNMFAVDTHGRLVEGWPVFLGDSVSSWPSAGDVDGDGEIEIVVHSSSGNLYVVNGSGVVSSGWPIPSNSSGVQTRYGSALSDVDGDAASEIFFASHDSRVSAVHGDGKPVRDWPVAVGASVGGGPALTDLEDDGRPELFQAAGDSLMVCLELPYSVSNLEWPQKGSSSARTNCLEERGAVSQGLGGGLIVRGNVHCQPNPSRGTSTSIRYFLSAPAVVRVEIFDLSGRKVYSGEKNCPATENSFEWSHKGFPPGVYIVRVEAEASGRKDVAFTKASVVN